MKMILLEGGGGGGPKTIEKHLTVRLPLLFGIDPTVAGSEVVEFLSVKEQYNAGLTVGDDDQLGPALDHHSESDQMTSSDLTKALVTYVQKTNDDQKKHWDTTHGPKHPDPKDYELTTRFPLWAEDAGKKVVQLVEAEDDGNFFPAPPALTALSSLVRG